MSKGEETRVVRLTVQLCARTEMMQSAPALGGGELVLLLSRGVGLLLELREAGGTAVDVVTVDGICSFASCSSTTEGQWAVVVGRDNGRVKLLRVGLCVEPEVQSRGEWNLWDLQHNSNGQLRYINVQEEDLFAFAPLIKSGQQQLQSVTFVHFDEQHGFVIAATDYDRCVSLTPGADGVWTHTDVDLSSCGAAPRLDPTCAAVLNPSDPRDALQACVVVSITREVTAAKSEPVVFLGCRCGALLWFACSWLKRGKGEQTQTAARVAAFYSSPVLGLGLACLFPPSHACSAGVSHLVVVEANAVSGVGVAPLQEHVVGDSFRHSGFFGAAPPAWLPTLPGLRRGSFLYCDQGGVWVASFAARSSSDFLLDASASASALADFVPGTLSSAVSGVAAGLVTAAVRGDKLHSVTVYQSSGLLASVSVPPDFLSSCSSSEAAALTALQELLGGRPSAGTRGGVPALPSAPPPPALKQVSALGTVLSDVSAAAARLEGLEAQITRLHSELLQLASLSTLFGRDSLSSSSSSSSWLRPTAGAEAGAGVLGGGVMGMTPGWRSGLRVDFVCRAGGSVLAKHSSDHGAAAAAATAAAAAAAATTAAATTTTTTTTTTAVAAAATAALATATSTTTDKATPS